MPLAASARSGADSRMVGGRPRDDTPRAGRSRDRRRPRRPRRSAHRGAAAGLQRGEQGRSAVTAARGVVVETRELDQVVSVGPALDRERALGRRRQHQHRVEDLGDLVERAQPGQARREHDGVELAVGDLARAGCRRCRGSARPRAVAERRSWAIRRGAPVPIREPGAARASVSPSRATSTSRGSSRRYGGDDQAVRRRGGQVLVRVDREVDLAWRAARRAARRRTRRRRSGQRLDRSPAVTISTSSTCRPVAVVMASATLRDWAGPARCLGCRAESVISHPRASASGRGDGTCVHGAGSRSNSSRSSWRTCRRPARRRAGAPVRSACSSRCTRCTVWATLGGWSSGGPPSEPAAARRRRRRRPGRAARPRWARRPRGLRQPSERRRPRRRRSPRPRRRRRGCGARCQPAGQARCRPRTPGTSGRQPARRRGQGQVEDQQPAGRRGDRGDEPRGEHGAGGAVAVTTMSAPARRRPEAVGARSPPSTEAASRSARRRCGWRHDHRPRRPGAAWQRQRAHRAGADDQRGAARRPRGPAGGPQGGVTTRTAPARSMPVSVCTRLPTRSACWHSSCSIRPACRRPARCVGVAELPEDLRLADDHRVEPGGDREQVLDGPVLVVHVEVVGQLVGGDAGVSASQQPISSTGRRGTRRRRRRPRPGCRSTATTSCVCAASTSSRAAWRRHPRRPRRSSRATGAVRWEMPDDEQVHRLLARGQRPRVTAFARSAAACEPAASVDLAVLVEGQDLQLDRERSTLRTSTSSGTASTRGAKLRMLRRRRRPAGRTPPGRPAGWRSRRWRCPRSRTSRSRSSDT